MHVMISGEKWKYRALDTKSFQSWRNLAHKKWWRKEVLLNHFCIYIKEGAEMSFVKADRWENEDFAIIAESHFNCVPIVLELERGPKAWTRGR
jgi:hypothetical protein